MNVWDREPSKPKQQQSETESEVQLQKVNLEQIPESFSKKANLQRRTKADSQQTIPQNDIGKIRSPNKFSLLADMVAGLPDFLDNQDIV